MVLAILIALAPIVLLVAAGNLMRRRGFLADTFWPQAERLSYFVLLPCLFIHGLAMADLDGVPVLRLAAVLVVSTFGTALLMVLARRVIGGGGPAFTSVFQGGVRFNNYVGVTAAIALFGAPAIGLSAVANAAIVPTVNILVILVFAQYAGAEPSIRGVVRGIVTNPLVVACAIGVTLQATGLGLPPGVAGAVKALGTASLPLGLLCVGAAFQWKAVGTAVRPTVAAMIFKFGVMPAATVLACLAFGLSGPPAAVAVLFQTLPTASSAYILARQLGGDAPLMASIVTVQTVAAAIAVPAVLLLSPVVLQI
ncbi:transporter [Acuticoccus sediminis]|uniref:Transporter n=1 Tax=Acuticoccus sediminis TaxID=2184697 RepID=A0A8B2NUC7_9HYPH|nr:AEC family transporter [Acuticoccus sediminis]RAI02581.1 transporter [Acuticoccus sediminis]